MTSRRNGRALVRANATESEDINAQLMKQTKGLTIKLTRVVVRDETTTPQSARRRDRPPTKKTDGFSMPQLDKKNSGKSQPNVTDSTSQQAKRSRRQPAKMNAEPKKRSLRSNSSADDVSFETPERRMKHKKRDQPRNTLQDINSESTDDEQVMADTTAKTSQQVKRRGRQPAKMNFEPKKRSLRSNSSTDDVSFVTPERRMKRKKRDQPLNTLPVINSESPDDEHVMADSKNSTNVTHRRREIPSRSTEEDDSMSQVDSESKELTHSDASESMLVTNKLAHSTMVHGKTPSTHLNETDNDMTPLLCEKLNSPELKSQNSSPGSGILLGHGPNTVTQNTMDEPIDETPRNAPKSKENRREKMNLLKSTFGKVDKPSSSTDNNDRNDPEQGGDMSTSSNGPDPEEIVNETDEITDDEQSEDQVAQKEENRHSLESVFDTPDEMDFDDVETNAGVNTSVMNVSDENVGETSAMSVEENNNVKAPSKQIANVAHSATGHQERIEKNDAIAGKDSTAMTKYVLNELSDVLKIRNERKKANELQSESVNDDARHYGLSDLTTVTKTPIYEETAMAAHQMDNNSSHNESDDADMMSNNDPEMNFEEPAPSTSASNNSPPKGGKERRLPDAPTPYRKVNTGVTVETNCDDKEPGPSTSAFEAPVPKPKNKRKLTPVDVAEPHVSTQLKMPTKIPRFTNNGFLEETFYESQTDGVFVFNAKPNELNVAMNSFHPRKRQRIIELEPDEVIVIQRSKKHLKNRTSKKISKRRSSD